MLELIKPLLYGNHDNHLTTKCFLPNIKDHPISNASLDCNFQLQDSKLSEVIDLSLLILKIKFLWGWDEILERDKWKIGIKLEKCSISKGFEGEFLPFVPEW